MSSLLKEYILGDMTACYVTDQSKGTVGLVLLPEGISYQETAKKSLKADSLVQLKLVGDIYDEAYAQGISMRNGETVRRLRFQEQKEIWVGEDLIIRTYLEDDRGYQVTHHLRWRQGTQYLKIWCSFQNFSKEIAMLEMFESFSLSEISPCLEGDGYHQIDIYRIRSVWSQEGRLECIPLEDLQLDPAWDTHAVRCEKYGQVGSMPVNKFFPFAAVRDRQNQIFWGAQIAHPASWQMEFYRKDDGLSLSGGLADRDFGHWLRTVNPGETFTTPGAIVSVCRTESVDVFTNRLTQAGEEAMAQIPESEEELPVVFNEYCTTWGCPSHENIMRILEAIRGRGFCYFVIDCGWYKEKGVPWDISMGDYQISKELFPDGLQKTVDAIRAEGLIPGIWFEIENVGNAAKAYHYDEHLLKRDGRVLTSYFRRFWDMRDPWVEQYLTEKVIGTLKEYGFGYMKIDYNETIGIGCDGAESLGEGLRSNMQATVDFIAKVKREVPDIVLENCASGGHRLEPQMMGLMSMASFSDAHECPEIPIVAADLHRVILPRQSQIWAVIRKDDSLRRIAYSMSAAFLGRMCISGDVTELSEAQWKVIDDGIAFYKKIVPIIKKGQSYRYGTGIRSIRHPAGWQAVVRAGDDNGMMAVIHTFRVKDIPGKIELPLPEGPALEIKEVYSYQEEEVRLEGRKLIYEPKGEYSGVAVYLG